MASNEIWLTSDYARRPVQLRIRVACNCDDAAGLTAQLLLIDNLDRGIGRLAELLTQLHAVGDLPLRVRAIQAPGATLVALPDGWSWYRVRG